MLNVNEKRLLSLFKTLVETDSPTGKEREVCDILKNEFEKLGVTPEEDNVGNRIDGSAGNLYAYIDGDLDLPPILFSAHMDTVEPALNKKLIIDSDGKMHSDGTTVLGADDFAGVSAILEAIKVIKENNIPHRPIEIVFSVSEEVYCKGIREFDFSKIKSKEAYVFDLDGAIGTSAYAAPTILSFTAEIQGKSSHAGFAPEKGIHSIKTAAIAISSIPCGRIDEDTTVNVGTIQGGTANNIVPDKCTVTGEIRSFRDDKALAQYENIKRIFEHHVSEVGAKLSISYTRHITAFETDLNHNVVKRFKNVCADLDLKTDLVRTFGGSDNNILSQNGIKGLVVSTAMNACHTTGEWTTIEDLKKASQLALNLIISKEK